MMRIGIVSPRYEDSGPGRICVSNGRHIPAKMPRIDAQLRDSSTTGRAGRVSAATVDRPSFTAMLGSTAMGTVLPQAELSPVQRMAPRQGEVCTEAVGGGSDDI